MSDDLDTRAYQGPDGLVVPWRVGYRPHQGPSKHDAEIIELQTPEQFAALPDGTVLISIFGEEKTKGVDLIDLDTRMGRLAWGLPDRRV